jgi:hypothetical protein
VRDVGVQLGAAVGVADRAVLVQAAAALVAEPAAEVVLGAAVVQRSVSFRDGMATKKPLAPSMILRSRMTNMSSNVMLQKACSRSLLPELSSMSLMRTSVISTASTPLREALSGPQVTTRTPS